jgi:hypothetical protein
MKHLRDQKDLTSHANQALLDPAAARRWRRVVKLHKRASSDLQGYFAHNKAPFPQDCRRTGNVGLL